MPLHGLIPAAGRMMNGALQSVQQDASCNIHRNGSLEQLLLLEAGAVEAAGGYTEGLNDNSEEKAVFLPSFLRKKTASRQKIPI